MKGNRLRIEEVLWKGLNRVPKFALGMAVTARRLADAPTGVVVAVFVDYRAAVDMGIVPETWYEMQRPLPLTPPGGFWYSVVVAHRPTRGIFQGEDDLIGSNVGAA